MAKASTTSRLREFISSFEHLYKFAAHLAFVGVIGTIIGSYFQYTSWREEKILTRHQAELGTAITADNEVILALSSVMNLQSMLLFSFKNAEGYEPGSISAQMSSYISNNAKGLQKRYFEARTNLRQNIDALADKAALFIDRPAEPDSRRAEDQLVRRPIP